LVKACVCAALAFEKICGFFVRVNRAVAWQVSEEKMFKKNADKPINNLMAFATKIPLQFVARSFSVFSASHGTPLSHSWSNLAFLSRRIVFLPGPGAPSLFYNFYGVGVRGLSGIGF
jgi:hypothetical protein